MGFDNQKAPEIETQDSVLEQAKKDVRDMDPKEGETKAQIDAKITRLTQDKEALQAQYEEANFEKRDKDAVQLLKAIDAVDAQLQILEAAQKTAPFEAAPLSKPAMERAEKQAATKAELEADIQKQTGIIDSTDPSITSKQKEAAHEQRADSQAKLDRLTSSDRRTEAMAKVEQYKQEEAVSRAEEARQLAALEAQMNGETPPETPDAKKPEGEDVKKEEPAAGDTKATGTEKPTEKSNSVADRMGNITLGIAQDIASKPPKTSMDKIWTSTKVFLLRITVAMGNGEATWCKEIPEAQRKILEKVTGLKITADGKNEAGEDKFKLEWVEPDPEFIGPDKNTQDLFEQYYSEAGASNWIDSYDAITKLADGKPKLSDVRASIPADSKEPKDLALKALLDDLQAAVGKDEDPLFADALSKKGYSLLDKTKTGTEAVPQTQENTEAREKLVGDFVKIFEHGVDLTQKYKLNSDTSFDEYIDHVVADYPNSIDPMTANLLTMDDNAAAIKKTLSEAPSVDILKDVDGLIRRGSVAPEFKTTVQTELAQGKLSENSLQIITDAEKPRYDFFERILEKHGTMKPLISRLSASEPALKSTLDPILTALEENDVQSLTVTSSPEADAKMKEWKISQGRNHFYLGESPLLTLSPNTHVTIRLEGTQLVIETEKEDQKIAYKASSPEEMKDRVAFEGIKTTLASTTDEKTKLSMQTEADAIVAKYPTWKSELSSSTLAS